jgi:putative serine protease PepD
VNGLRLRLERLAGIRMGSGIRPDAGPRNLAHPGSTWAVVACVAMLVVLVGPAVGFGLTTRSEMTTQARLIRTLQTQIDALKAHAQPQTDWSLIAVAVEPSVLTVSTANDLGSGWVVESDSSGSDVVTNLHVVVEALDAGVSIVDLGIGDLTMKGRIVTVDANDDLAVIHTATRLPALQRAAVRPRLAETVMAIGSPLGLGGTVSIGVISGSRSIDGSDYIQFSAAISPGNSGGPVVDAQGLVVAVATAKFVAPGAEALSLAIPVQTVCRVVTCGSGDQ